MGSLGPGPGPGPGEPDVHCPMSLSRDLAGRGSARGLVGGQGLGPGSPRRWRCPAAGRPGRAPSQAPRVGLPGSWAQASLRRPPAPRVARPCSCPGGPARCWPGGAATRPTGSSATRPGWPPRWPGTCTEVRAFQVRAGHQAPGPGALRLRGQRCRDSSKVERPRRESPDDRASPKHAPVPDVESSITGGARRARGGLGPPPQAARPTASSPRGQYRSQ